MTEPAEGAAEPESTTGTAAPARPSGMIARRVPLVGWLRRADAGSYRADLLAGLTVAAMLVPQSMAYAALAGMPPVTGLYAATVPLVAYAVLGTSGQLAFGPVAIVSLLTASTLAPLAGGDPGRYIALAGLLALLVGGIQVLLGLLRAGRLTGLLSHPVISGFTSAAAIVIATSQLDKLLGISVGRPDGWLARLGAILTQLPATHLPTLVVGVLAIAVLVLGRRYRPRFPTPLVVVILATAAVPLLGLEALGVAVLGEVPGGLPRPSLPTAPVDTIIALLPGAVIIALLSYLEGISVARAVAARTRDRIDPDQELLASGAANLTAGLFQAFPVAGGFSRTAVNHAAGARSPIATLVTAATVLLALLVMAPLFTTLPQVVLAAVVLAAVATLVDLREARHAWQVERTDGIALTVTFLATLLLGVELGIGLGIAVSLLLSLWRVGVPRIEVERSLDGVVLHVEGDLLPASSTRLLEVLEDHLDAPGACEEHLVLDLAGVPSADVSGINAIAALDVACQAAGVELHLAGVREGVRAPLERAHLAERFAARSHRDVAAALTALGHRPAAGALSAQQS
ncbi:MAG: STAS domain-containing protein [Nitriliruptor sp.]|nr:MAG: STAS domain-containing protein [Nitriliruptor sp.]